MTTSNSRSLTSESFDAFNASAQTAALSTIKSGLVALPHDVTYHRSVDAQYADALDHCSGRVLGLVNRLVGLADGKGKERVRLEGRDDIVDRFQSAVVDAMDGLLERAVSNIPAACADMSQYPNRTSASMRISVATRLPPFESILKLFGLCGLYLREGLTPTCSTLRTYESRSSRSSVPSTTRGTADPGGPRSSTSTTPRRPLVIICRTRLLVAKTFQLLGRVSFAVAGALSSLARQNTPLPLRDPAHSLPLTSLLTALLSHYAQVVRRHAVYLGIHAHGACGDARQAEGRPRDCCGP